MDPVNSVIRHMLCRHPSYVQAFLGTFIGGSGVCVWGGGLFRLQIGVGTPFLCLSLKEF